MKFNVPNRSGLVLELLGDGNWNDTSGNGFNGTPTNVTYATTDRGYQSQTGVFNGTNARVNVVWWKFSIASWSVSFWINSSATSGMIMSERNGNTQFARIAKGNWTVTFQSTFNSNDTGANNHNFLSNNLDTWWNHVVVWQESSATAWITINWRTTTIALNKAYNNASPVNPAIWAEWDQLSSYVSFCTMNLQSLRVFNRKISESEIRDWYLEGLRQLGGASLYPMIDGLKYYWDLRGDANDIVSWANGTLKNAPSVATSRLGFPMGYVLNGSNQAIDLATLSSTGTAYSFGIWVKYSGTATNKFFFTSNAGGTNQNVLGYDNGQAKVEFAFWNGSTTTKIQATTAYNDGGWHLWICTKNGAAGAIYTDGSANGSAGSGLHSQAVVGGLDAIGYQRQANVQYLNGTVGECFFIDRSISAAEAKAITDLMNKDYLLPFA